MFAWSPLYFSTTPCMLIAMRMAYSFQPSINWSIMELDTVISCWFKLIWIKIPYFSSLPSGTNRLLSCWSTSIYFYMNNVMFLTSQLSIKICATIKNQISWFQILKVKNNWQSIILIRLIPSFKSKTQFFSHIINYLSN